MTIYRVIKSTEKCKCLLTVMQLMLQKNGDHYNKKLICFMATNQFANEKCERDFR